MNLSEEEKEELMRIAKESIYCAVRGEEMPIITVTSERLKEKCGAFVTITKEGNLRGCIGYSFPIASLYEVVSEVAQSAALHDPRFPSLTEDELDDIEIEISVLSQLENVSDVSEIEVGKHGLLIERRGYKGLLLPQVAIDHNWDRIKFLEQTCYKAGLDKNAWKGKDTIIKKFSAEIFGERKHPK
jgi:AmmeMemoRadiSam system protein A